MQQLLSARDVQLYIDRTPISVKKVRYTEDRKKICGEFEYIGKRLVNEGLVGGNFGNMSARDENGFFITKTGSYLDVCEEVRHVTLKGEFEPGTSSEWRVHCASYNAVSQALAMVHAHPAHSVAASFAYREICPIDSEGKMLCPVIPVVTGEPGTDELAENVAEGLLKSKVVIAKGHGTFAVGKDLREAYLLTSIAEHACRVIYLSRGFND